ncbi:hypothetical protein BD410DRAFT_826332 [Rickenella mellea]|uniref:Uncharacterized protein n=1 Tax=Rickenella mellea TaxID=50990 RepID=A0A4Y7QEL9_9AGAM|nr:hypothetical protein BD410DRAFT_826332 [Rickenella mellea]
MRCYHESLLYFRGVHKTQPMAPSVPEGTTPPEKKKTELEELMEKVYSNLSMCHMKKKNWERVIECTDRALGINPNNEKAIFRKGKAQGELGFFEKAEKTLKEAIEKHPAEAPAINQELERIRQKEKEVKKKHDSKMRGFLSREKDILQPESKASHSDTAPAEKPEPAKIEEVGSDNEEDKSPVKETKHEEAKIEEVDDDDEKDAPGSSSKSAIPV